MCHSRQGLEDPSFATFPFPGRRWRQPRRSWQTPILAGHSQTLSGLIGVDSRESGVQAALKSRY